MVVAKRQRNGKAHKNGTKENPWTRVRTSGETNTAPSWLAQFAYGRLKVGRRQTYKSRGSRWIEASPLGSAHPHTLRMYSPLLVK